MKDPDPYSQPLSPYHNCGDHTIKKTDMEKNKFKEECKQLWKDTVIAYTKSSNSTNEHHAAKWADQIVSDFKDRYEPNN